MSRNKRNRVGSVCVVGVGGPGGSMIAKKNKQATRKMDDGDHDLCE